MIIHLYTNTAEPERVDKSSFLTALTGTDGLSGTLREATSLTAPVITVQGTLTAAQAAACNYAYVPDFGRYYYVKEIVSVRTGLWQLTMQCDVLMSFATQIKANTAVIRRQESRFNLMLDDGIFKVYQDPIVKNMEFPGGFTTQTYILLVAGE